MATTTNMLFTVIEICRANQDLKCYHDFSVHCKLFHFYWKDFNLKLKNIFVKISKYFCVPLTRLWSRCVSSVLCANRCVSALQQVSPNVECSRLSKRVWVSKTDQTWHTDWPHCSFLQRRRSSLFTANGLWLIMHSCEMRCQFLTFWSCVWTSLWVYQGLVRIRPQCRRVGGETQKDLRAAAVSPLPGSPKSWSGQSVVLASLRHRGKRHCCYIFN